MVEGAEIMSDGETLGKILGELKGVTGTVNTLSGKMDTLNREVGTIATALDLHVKSDDKNSMALAKDLSSINKKCSSMNIRIGNLEIKEEWDEREEEITSQQVVPQQNDLVAVAAKTGIQKLIGMIPVILLAIIAGAIMVGFLVADLRSPKPIVPTIDITE